MKVEVSLEKEDLYSKASLLAAIERDCEIKKMAGEESILNPKMEISIKRQDAGEIFAVTRMAFVVKRLEKLKDRSDTILLEVKEQIISFEPNKPTIRIMVNSVPQEGVARGRRLVESVGKAVNLALDKFEKSRYDKESKVIVCGKCSAGVKVREKGAAKTIVNYFVEKHFNICGNRVRKRKAKNLDEVKAIEKRRKVAEKMDVYWSNLRMKANKDDLALDTEAEDVFEDPDLMVDNDIEVVAGSSTSSG